MTSVRAALFVIAAIAFAGAAQAQTAPTAAGVQAPRPRLDLSDPHAFVSRPYAQAQAAADGPAPRTEVDHQFTRDGLTGEAGYLCGLDPFGADANPAGGPSSGMDRQGTFLGARLGYAFR